MAVVVGVAGIAMAATSSSESVAARLMQGVVAAGLGWHKGLLPGLIRQWLVAGDADSGGGRL